MEERLILEKGWIIESIIKYCTQILQQIEEHGIDHEEETELESIVSRAKSGFRMSGNEYHPLNSISGYMEGFSWSANANVALMVSKDDDGYLQLSGSKAKYDFHNFTYEEIKNYLGDLQKIKIEYNQITKTYPELPEKCTELPEAIESREGTKYEITVTLDKSSGKILYVHYYAFAKKDDFSENWTWGDPKYDSENIDSNRERLIDWVAEECAHLDKQIEKYEAELKNRGDLKTKIPHQIGHELAEMIKRCNDPRYPKSFFRGGGDRDSWCVNACSCEKIIRNDDGYLELVNPSSNDILYLYKRFSVEKLVYGDKTYKLIKVTSFYRWETLPPLPEKCTEIPYPIENSSSPHIFVSTARVDLESGEIAYTCDQTIKFGWRYDISNSTKEASRWINPEYNIAPPIEFFEDNDCSEITPESVDMKRFENNSIEMARAYERRYELKRREKGADEIDRTFLDLNHIYKHIYGPDSNHPDIIRALKLHIFSIITAQEYSRCRFNVLWRHYMALLKMEEATLPADHPEVERLRTAVANLQALAEDENREHENTKDETIKTLS